MVITLSETAKALKRSPLEILADLVNGNLDLKPTYQDKQLNFDEERIINLVSKDEKNEYTRAVETLRINNLTLLGLDQQNIWRRREEVLGLEKQVALIKDIRKTILPRLDISFSEKLEKSYARIEDLCKGELKKRRTALKRNSSTGMPTRRGNVKIILNHYQDNVHIMLPIKESDLTDKNDTLADKLYDYVEETLDDYVEGIPEKEYGEAFFTPNNYIVFNVPGNDKRAIARALTDNAPEEFGGGNGGAVFYLKIANDFSFLYGTGQKEENINLGEDVVDSLEESMADSPSETRDKITTKDQLYAVFRAMEGENPDEGFKGKCRMILKKFDINIGGKEVSGLSLGGHYTTYRNKFNS